MKVGPAGGAGRRVGKERREIREGEGGCGAGRGGRGDERRERGCGPGRERGGGLFYLGPWAELWALKFS